MTGKAAFRAVKIPTNFFLKPHFRFSSRGQQHEVFGLAFRKKTGGALPEKKYFFFLARSFKLLYY